MQQPFVNAELQRVGTAFSGAAEELSAVLRRLSDSDLDTVGTPRCDAAVTTGLADLRSGLSRLEAMSEQCVAVLSRHLPDQLSRVVPLADADAAAGPHSVRGTSDAS